MSDIKKCECGYEMETTDYEERCTNIDCEEQNPQDNRE